MRPICVELCAPWLGDSRGAVFAAGDVLARAGHELRQPADAGGGEADVHVEDDDGRVARRRTPVDQERRLADAHVPAVQWCVTVFMIEEDKRWPPLTTAKTLVARHMAARVRVKRCTCWCSSCVSSGLAHGTPQPSTPSTKAWLLSVSTSGLWHLAVVLNLSSRTSFYASQKWERFTNDAKL